MVLVHHHGAEAPLPEVPGAAPALMDDAGVAPMHRRQRAAQAVLVARGQDEMDVVGHQTPGPDFDAGVAARGGEQIATERVIGVGEEHPRAAVAALGDVMRQTGNDDARKPSHGAIMADRVRRVNRMHCHRNHNRMHCHRNHSNHK